MEGIERRKLNKARLFFPTLFLSLALTSPISAQQQQASEPAPSNQQKPKTQDSPAGQDKGQNSDKGQNAKGQDEKDKPGEPLGKTKLERETGTVNDRILAVMPNYGTVENADKLPPISTGQKFRLATAGVLDYFTFPFIGTLAAIDQANNSPKSWGQGWGAYGQRYGASFADNGIGTYMTTAIFPSLLHEDPRYYQLGKGTIGHRTFYSLGRLFITRTDSGHNRFNYSEMIGNATAPGLSNTYHAPEDRTLPRNLGTWGMLNMWDGVSNLMKEFWPDIRRKVFHKNSP